MYPHLKRLFHQACQRYSLLENGDTILIGLSGGKDSLLLTELLGEQAKIYVPRITVEAVHVRVKERNYQSDTSYLENFCHQAGVPFHIIDTEIATPQQVRDNQSAKDPCFLCSWYRRKAMLDYAQAHGFNKIALGHHQDDVLHTLLMNLIYEGRFTSIEPSLPLDKMPITWIRPLWLIPEQDIIDYAAAADYRKQLKFCPYEHKTSRTEAKQLLSYMQTLAPNVRSSMIHAMTRG